MNLLEKLDTLTIKKKELEEEILGVQSAIYANHIEVLNGKEEGSFNFENGEYKLKITKKNTVSVDQEKASKLDFGFIVKRNFSKTEYNKLNDAQKEAVNNCLTTKPAKPSFKVERL